MKGHREARKSGEILDRCDRGCDYDEDKITSMSSNRLGTMKSIATLVVFVLALWYGVLSLHKVAPWIA